MGTRARQKKLTLLMMWKGKGRARACRNDGLLHLVAGVKALEMVGVKPQVAGVRVDLVEDVEAAVALSRPRSQHSSIERHKLHVLCALAEVDRLLHKT